MQQNKVIYESKVWNAFENKANGDFILIVDADNSTNWKYVRADDVCPYNYFWQCRNDSLHYLHNRKIFSNGLC